MRFENLGNVAGDYRHGIALADAPKLKGRGELAAATVRLGPTAAHLAVDQS